MGAGLSDFEKRLKLRPGYVYTRIVIGRLVCEVRRKSLMHLPERKTGTPEAG